MLTVKALGVIGGKKFGNNVGPCRVGVNRSIDNFAKKLNEVDKARVEIKLGFPNSNIRRM